MYTTYTPQYSAGNNLAANYVLLPFQSHIVLRRISDLRPAPRTVIQLEGRGTYMSIYIRKEMQMQH